MKTYIRITLILAILMLIRCAAEKNYQLYSNWDSDADRALDRDEFADAYVSSGYFDKWSVGDKPISYTQLYAAVYRAVDSDGNLEICPDEFSSNMRPFYFGMFSQRFDAWDEDGNHTLSSDEFHAHIARSKLASHWDLDGNAYISQREMAEGMFRQCDLNNNGVADEPEFNLWNYLR